MEPDALLIHAPPLRARLIYFWLPPLGGEGWGGGIPRLRLQFHSRSFVAELASKSGRLNQRDFFISEALELVHKLVDFAVVAKFVLVVIPLRLRAFA
jgi:hypothetical protein